MRPFGAYSIQEKDVPAYTVPDPLLKTDGTRVTSPEEWTVFQREKILDILKEYSYGEILPHPDFIEAELLALKTDALNNAAVRKEIRIHSRMKNGKHFSFDMLLYIPKKHQGPVPVFLGLNFNGNHSTTDEPDVLRTGEKFPEIRKDPSRGSQTGRWQTPLVISRGYASATVCYHDLFPNLVDGAGGSAFTLFFEPEQYADIDKTYSVIGAWTWGLSRMLDVLAAEADIDVSRAAVHGHSRLGKTALWTGAVDPRFKFVISNCSGCCGGALHRRKFGENLSQHFESHVQNGVPPWFVRKLGEYIWREEDLPFDQHELIAMMAPRPVCIGTSVLDHYADPKGEFVSCRLASPVYHLFGMKGLPVDHMPPVDTPVDGEISFHCHSDGHDQTEWDWRHYLDLADRFLSNKHF